MRKLAAILLLLIFLINLIGYRGWFYLAEVQWQKHMQQSLDADQFNEDELITIKAPLMLPYVTDTKDFVRTDGEIVVKGKLYRYVKSKVENGEYVLLCLPDRHKQKIENARQDFFKQSNDINTDSKSGAGGKSLGKMLFSDYDQQYSEFNLASVGMLQDEYSYYACASLHCVPHGSPEQPPEAGSDSQL